MTKNTKKAIIEIEDLKSLIKIFSRNWYIIVICLAISAVASYLYSYKLPEIYGAKSQILLKNDETYDYQNQLYKGLGYYQAYQDNSNQIRVITSNDLIKLTLSKLKVEVSYFIVGRLKETEVYESMPFEFSAKLLDPSLYEQRMKFKILNENQYQLTYKKGNEEFSKVFLFNKEEMDSDFILSVYKNDNINDKTILSLKEIDYEVQVHSMNNLIYKYKNLLSVENVEGTSILELTLEDQIPFRAVVFLDTLSKVYIDYTAQTEYIVNDNTLKNIDRQLIEIVDVLDSLEDNLEVYKAGKGILDLPKQEDEYFKQLLSYEAKKRQIEMNLKSLNALEEYIMDMGNSRDNKLLPPSFYISDDDDYMKAAVNELYSLQMNRNRALYGATEENKGIENLDQTVELLRKNMLVYIHNTKKALNQNIEFNDTQINDYTRIIKNVPRTQRELLAIQRKADVNEDLYVYLLQKRANTVIARAGILPQTSIIEAAHSIGIVRPDKMKILYFFLLGGAVTALTIIFLRIVFFSKIESLSELKTYTNLPALGEVVYKKGIPDEYLLVDKSSQVSVKESFRTIRTNLEYLAAGTESKVLLITSYNPGEGKTFCSVNLATILAKADKKVVLIELDLHKPKIQIAFNMNSKIGVSSILIGKSDIVSVIRPTQIENLSVILSGPTPPNASEIILSKRLDELLQYARLNFDYVILDTPPIGLITDALVLMKKVDISLFVVNTRYANKQLLTTVEEMVDTSKIKNFAFILNGSKRKKTYYYYGYRTDYTKSTD